MGVGVSLFIGCTALLRDVVKKFVFVTGNFNWLIFTFYVVVILFS